MTSFGKSSTQQWPTVHIATPSGVEAYLSLAQEAGLAVGEVTETIRTVAEFFSAVAVAMRFPAYFGKNQNAFIDCLRTLDETWPAPGHVLILRDANELWRAEPGFVHWLFEDWLAVGEERIERYDKRIHLVWQLKTHQYVMKFPPV